MNQKWEGCLTLSIYIAIVAVGFAVGILGILVLWLLLRSGGVTADFWVMMEALSTAIAAAGGLGAGFFAYRELSEISSSRYLEVANQLFEELNSQENVQARRWIFQNLPPDPVEGMKGLSSEGQAALKRVLNSLDHVAFLTQSGWIPERIVMPWMHPMIAKSWEKLEPYVFYERQRRSEAYYYRFAEELSNHCRQWRVKHLKEKEIRWVKDAL
jgi:hypothetical protein